MAIVNSIKFVSLCLAIAIAAPAPQLGGLPEPTGLPLVGAVNINAQDLCATQCNVAVAECKALQQSIPVVMSPPGLPALTFDVSPPW
jgi:hypothetical protein